MNIGEIPSQLSEASQQRRADLSRRRAGRFIRGPLPLVWLQRAAKLPGKALAIALAIWYMQGLRNSGKDIVVSGKLADEFGVGRKALYRALDAIEEAGLITVRRRRGKSARVTIQRYPK